MKRERLSLLFKAALAVGILGYLVHVVDLREIRGTAEQASLGWIAASVALLPLNLFIEGTLWRRITRLVMPPDNRRTVFGALLSGYALGFFTPGRLGELAGRSFYHDHGNKWELSALVMYQRMIDMLVGVTIGLVAVIIFMATNGLGLTATWIAIAATGVVTIPLLGTVLVRPGLAHAIFARWLRRESLLRPLMFLKRVETAHTLPFVALATCRYLVFVTQFVFLIFAFEAAASLIPTYGGASMTFYAKYLIPSVTMMDLGIREGSAVYFMGAMGFSQAAAFNASLFMFMINLVLPSAAGVPFVMRLRLRKSTAASATTAGS